MRPRAPVRCGIDVLLGEEHRLRELRSLRVGLLTHAPAVTRDCSLGLDALLRAGVRPRRLFGPEHGVRGTAQDMIAVDEEVDPISGIPSTSLYGHTFDSLTPSPSDLRELDLLLIDLVDVGSRYYTYVYTAALAAQAATRAGVRVWILDRPNPIGGEVEGAPVADGFQSFVGLLQLPQRHGLTLAEVVRWARDVEGWEIDCEILPVQGWSRRMWFDDTDVPWVLPSPNMPTLDTALVYPGQCILEGTNLSEGRGTTRPFEIFGAPWCDARAWADMLGSLSLPGVLFRPLAFEPTFQKHARIPCQGLQIHVTDRSSFRPVRTGAAVVWSAARLFQPQFQWRDAAYEFVEELPAIDLLFGTDRARLLMDSGAEFDDITRLLDTPPELRHLIESVRLDEYGDRWTN